MSKKIKWVKNDLVSQNGWILQETEGFTIDNFSSGILGQVVLKDLKNNKGYRAKSLDEAEAYAEHLAANA